MNITYTDYDKETYKVGHKAICDYCWAVYSGLTEDDLFKSSWSAYSYVHIKCVICNNKIEIVIPGSEYYFKPLPIIFERIKERTRIVKALKVGKIDRLLDRLFFKIKYILTGRMDKSYL